MWEFKKSRLYAAEWLVLRGYARKHKSNHQYECLQSLSLIHSVGFKASVLAFNFVPGDRETDKTHICLSYSEDKGESQCACLNISLGLCEDIGICIGFGNAPKLASSNDQRATASLYSRDTEMHANSCTCALTKGRHRHTLIHTLLLTHTYTSSPALTQPLPQAVNNRTFPLTTELQINGNRLFLDKCSFTTHRHRQSCLGP